MPRVARKAPGGLIYHVLNRAAGRMTLFRHPNDYLAFLRVFRDVREELDILGFCLMPNHWHLVLWPRRDGDLARFMQRLTITHVRRWVEHRHRVGYGSVYQGRYKSFPMQDNHHLLTVLRYVERNPLRAKLVRRAENWRWSSLGQPTVEAGAPPDRPATRNPAGGGGADPAWPTIPLADWPTPRPTDWLALVNRPQTQTWQARTEQQLGLGPLRRRGRPAREEKQG